MKTSQLIKEMNLYSEKLTNTNKALFDEILLKVRFSRIRERDAEEFSYYCLDLFLKAEEENCSVVELLGTSDISQFCNDYISGIRDNYNVYQKLYLRIRYIPMILLIFVGIWELLISYIIPNAVAGNGILLNIPVSLVHVIDFIYVMVLLEICLKHMAKISWELNHDDTKKANRKYFVIVFGFYLLTIAFFVVNKLLFTKVFLFHMNYLGFLLVVVTLMMIQYYYDNRNE